VSPGGRAWASVESFVNTKNQGRAVNGPMPSRNTQCPLFTGFSAEAGECEGGAVLSSVAEHSPPHEERRRWKRPSPLLLAPQWESPLQSSLVYSSVSESRET